MGWRVWTRGSFAACGLGYGVGGDWIGETRLGEQVDEGVDRCGVEFFRVGEGILDALALIGVEAGGEVVVELFYQQRLTFGAAAAVADGVFDGDFVGVRAVLEEDLDGVADGAFGGR